jgi:hypothetical protein
MLKFKQRLTKRRQHFEVEVIPNMRADAAERKGAWTLEEVEDYQKFKKLFRVFAVCFRFPICDAHILGPISNMVTASANVWQDTVITDEGDTTRLTFWEREIGHLAITLTRCSRT